MKTIMFPIYVNCQPSTGGFSGWYKIDDHTPPGLGEGTNNGWSRICCSLQEFADALYEAVISAVEVDPDTEWERVAGEYGIPVRFWEDPKFTKTPIQ